MLNAITRLSSNMLASKKENGDGVILSLVPHAVKVIKNLTMKAKRSKNTE